MSKVNIRVKLTLTMYVLITLVLGTIGSGKITAKGHPQWLVRHQLNDYFETLTADRMFTGAVLIAKKGKILLKKGYGIANYETGQPNRSKTVYAIASMGKSFTAMSIMMLQERGLLNVHDTVDIYIPELVHGDIITIHHLLNHTSGLYRYIRNPDSILWPVIDQYHAPDDLLTYFNGKPLRFAPGTQFEYCNSGYVLLGLIIERVSGMTYRDFVAINILEPLKMRRTSYDPTGHEFPFKAVGYNDLSTDPPTVAPYLHPSVAFAAGGIFSNVEDLYKWDRVLYTNRLVSYDSLRQMFSPGLDNYGYGWWIDTLQVDGVPHRQIWHWGSYIGFHSLIARLVDDDVTIILLLNISNVSFTDNPELLNKIRLDVSHILFSNYPCWGMVQSNAIFSAIKTKQ